MKDLQRKVEGSGSLFGGFGWSGLGSGCRVQYVMLLAKPKP